MKKKICVISLSNISQNGRVLRQIDCLSKNYDLLVIGYGKNPLTNNKYINIEWYELPLPKTPFLKTFKKIASRLIQIPIVPKTHQAYKIASGTNCDAYHAINWDSLPIAALAARKFGSKCIIDLQDSYDSWYWGLTSNYIKSILKKYVSDVNKSFVAFRALLEQHKKLGFEPIIIRNVPTLPDDKITFKGTDPNRIKLVHHGIGTSKRRSDLMIQAMAFCDLRYELHLILINHDSNYVSNLKKMADKIVPGRIFFHPPLSPDKIVQGISKYDVGFHLLYPTNRNNLLALPNKLFEFIAAGLAVCIGPSPSMVEVVNQYKCGVVAETFKPEALANQLNQTSADDWDKMKMASLNASKELNTTIEMRKLQKIYDSF